MNPTVWDPDNGNPELKRRMMCCINPDHWPEEVNSIKGLDQIWLDESFGWREGSHEDAKEFCKKLGSNKRLCPYSACELHPTQTLAFVSSVSAADVLFDICALQFVSF